MPQEEYIHEIIKADLESFGEFKVDKKYIKMLGFKFLDLNAHQPLPAKEGAHLPSDQKS